MPEDKRKICVWVPDDLYQDVVKAGYEGPTSAVIEAFKTLINRHKLDSDKKNTIFEYISSTDDINRYLKDLDGKHEPISYVVVVFDKNEDIKKIEKFTEILQKAPNPVEIVELRAKNEGLQKLLEEKDKRIEDLTNSVEMLSVFANYFKTLNQGK